MRRSGLKTIYNLQRKADKTSVLSSKWRTFANFLLGSKQMSDIKVCEIPIGIDIKEMMARGTARHSRTEADAETEAEC